MDKVQQELSAAIKTNFAMLGLNIADPSISCNCSITPGGNKPAAPVTITTSPTTPAIVSQFVAGGSSVITDDLPLSLVDPGNEPFILPAGVTADSIVSAQQTAAQTALKVAEVAAAAAAARLARTATVTVTSAGSGGSSTTVSATSSADNTATSSTTSTPYLSTTTTSSGLPSPIIESFKPQSERSRFPSVQGRLHTMQWETRGAHSRDGGWGLCGQLSKMQFVLFIVGVFVAWYLMKLSHERATGQ